MEFTIEDINILIEAMSAWESRGAAGHLMGSLMGAMLAKTDTQKEELEKLNAKEADERKERKIKDAEISILLKAKLIHMKDKLSVPSAADIAAERN